MNLPQGSNAGIQPTERAAINQVRGEIWGRVCQVIYLDYDVQRSVPEWVMHILGNDRNADMENWS